MPCSGFQEGDVARAALETREDCREAWRYLKSYAENVQEDVRLLTRLQSAASHRLATCTQIYCRNDTCRLRR